jgi:hypothetical protein
MLTLVELQKKFAESLINESIEIHHVIDQHKFISKTQQVAIYKNSILSAMQKALARIFPVCKKLVGEDFFNHIIKLYIVIYPSSTPDLNDYGESFAKYLEEIVEMTTLNYLSHVAHLEWNWHNLYRYAPDKKFNFKKLRSYEKKKEKIIFKLSQSTTLLTSVYPLHHIFVTNQTETEDESSIFLSPNQQYFFIIWRKDFEKKIEVLTEYEWFVLNCFKEKLSLEEISQRIINCDSKIDLSVMLPHMILCGWVVDVARDI